VHVNIAGGVVTVSFNGVPGPQYITQRSTNLTTGAGWIPISTNTTTTNVVFTVTDHFADIGSSPQSAYYRLVVP
jgi:hypothetical protein